DEIGEPSAGDLRTVLEAVIQAEQDMKAADLTLEELHKQYGDDAEEKGEYKAAEQLRDEAIENLSTLPASWSDESKQTKASALLQRPLMEDFERALEVAQSLACDVLGMPRARAA